MSDNDPRPSTSGSGRGSRTTNNRGWRPYNRFCRSGTRQAKEQPTSIAIPNKSNYLSNSVSVAPQEELSMSFEIDQRNTFHYPGWQFYFPQVKYSPELVIVQKVKAIQEHFKGHPGQYDLQETAKVYWYNLDIQFVLNDTMFLARWNTFKKDLCDEPESTLNIAGCAMNKLIPNNCQNSENSFKLIRARIQNYQPVVNLRAIKGENYDRLIAIHCTVTRVGPMEVLPTWMAFQCSTCKTEQSIKQPEGKVTFPTKCLSKNCKIRSNFKQLFYSPYSRCVAFQKILVQEVIRGQKYDEGRVPRSIEIQMTEDLVSSVHPGEDITLTGILKVRPREEYYNKQESATYNMFIKAVSVESRKKTASTSTSGILEFTEEDLDAINMIRAEPRLFRFLVQSLCPRIFGHEMVKAGLTLALFGGTDLATSKSRSELHVLVVGDPGIGKSQMLQACAEVSPRGIFVCGTGNSVAGLTVVVRKEKGGNVSSDNAIEAGALVLADGGVCCIDEFDKMSANHHALLEVMEQQTVSVAKAGAFCSLPARTSILAAANPIRGHYDRSKTVAENLKMGAPLLSRFDLVFILLDRHNTEFDNKLTDHIFSEVIQSTKKGKNRGDASILEDNEDCENLQERLTLENGEEIDYLPSILFQKYIAYARNKCQPTLSPQAATELKKFYLELRSTRAGMDAIPVTTRQLEALIRLTEARARTELSEIATRTHALDVIAITKFSLIDVFTTNDGELQMERNIMGSGMSQATQAKKFLQILQQRSSALGKSLFNLNELKDIGTYIGLSANVVNIIDSLNNQGYLLKKGQNIYQLH